MCVVSEGPLHGRTQASRRSAFTALCPGPDAGPNSRPALGFSGDGRAAEGDLAVRWGPEKASPRRDTGGLMQGRSVVVVHGLGKNRLVFLGDDEAGRRTG